MGIILGVLVVVVLVLFVYIEALKGQANKRRGEVEALTKELNDEKIKNARQSAELEGEKKRIVDMEAHYVKVMAESKAQFKELSAEVLKAREEELRKSNGREVSSLLEPMRQQLGEFQKAAEAAKKSSGDLGVKMESVFKSLQMTAGEFGKEAKSFKDALTGANKKQGNWGELILEQVLVDAGLKAGENYVMQTGSGSGIPDCQVFDPGSKKILIVDSKMSWTKYEEAYKLEEGAERSAALKEHVLSVKRHIDELLKANYPETQVPPRIGYEYVPITAMFVPSTAALQAALEEDETLIDYAFKRNVALVTPLTLFGFMRLVSSAWSKYQVQKNSEEIFKQAKMLVERVDKLFKSLEEVLGFLDKAKSSCESAMQQASIEAKGQCIKGPALKIIKLAGSPDKGAKSKTLVEAESEEV